MPIFIHDLVRRLHTENFTPLFTLYLSETAITCGSLLPMLTDTHSTGHLRTSRRRENHFKMYFLMFTIGHESSPFSINLDSVMLASSLFGYVSYCQSSLQTASIPLFRSPFRYHFGPSAMYYFSGVVVSFCLRFVIISDASATLDPYRNSWSYILSCSQIPHKSPSF